MSSQRENGTRITIGRLALAAAVLTAVAWSSAGTAVADGESRIITYCRGLSPNIVDFPYSGQVIGAQYKGAPYFTIHAGGSIWGGYGTEVTLNWTNLTTGASGSETRGDSVGFVIGNGSTINFSPPTGAGTIRTDFVVRNSGLVPQQVTCSGTYDIV